VKRRSRNLHSGRFLLSVALLAGGLIVGALISGCGGEKVESRWLDGEIVLDGVPNEWKGARTYIDNPNIVIGAINDETHLYIGLATPVRDLAMRIMGQGLIVWFEPKGRGDRKFGVRCPMGMADFKPGKPGGGDQARIGDLLQDAQTRLEIIGPSDDDTAILLNDGSHGVQVALGYRDGNFGYELKVPLAITGDRDFGIGGDTSKPIRVGFETPEINLESMRDAMPVRRPPGSDMGDDPGEMHRGGIDGEMRRGPMVGGTLEAIKVWTSITLATADGTPE
jgi:hypothetical protein